MATRSVRLDSEAEQALAEIQQQSKHSISAAVKLSLIAFRDSLFANQRKRPSEFFAQYDLGEGGYSIGPARQSKDLVREKLVKRRARR